MKLPPKTKKDILNDLAEAELELQYLELKRIPDLLQELSKYSLTKTEKKEIETLCLNY